MKAAARLFNCGESQALEVFIGIYMIVTAVEWLCGFLGIIQLPCMIPVILAGAFQAIAACYLSLRARHFACAMSFCAVIFLGLTYEGVLVGIACAWAWYRTLLDDKLERSR